jgi:hypothetical protein
LNEKLFIDIWIKKCLSEGIKNFPIDFIDESELERKTAPAKTLIIGQEFFGAYEIITTEGESVYQAKSYDEAKFIAYSARNRSGFFYLPKDSSQLKPTLKQYDEYLDSLLAKMLTDYKKTFSVEINFHSLSNEIFRILNLIRY